MCNRQNLSMSFMPKNQQLFFILPKYNLSPTNLAMYPFCDHPLVYTKQAENWDKVHFPCSQRQDKNCD